MTDFNNNKKINLCVEVLLLILSKRVKRTLRCDKSSQFEVSYSVVRFDIYRTIMLIFLSQRTDTREYIDLCDTIFQRLLKKIKNT